MIIVNENVVDNKHFPDGNFLINNIIADDYTNFVEWYYERPEELVQLIYITKHLKSVGNFCYLKMPYVPNARMDRVKSESEVFTLKYFAEVINSLEYDAVKVLDPHSYVTAALIDRIQIETAEKYIIKSILSIESDKLVVFYPDEGAMKRYSSLVKMPYAFGIKERDWVSGDIKGLGLSGDVDGIIGKDVLIVDDICSKGGTFYHSAKKLKEAGADKIYLYVTHCENSIFNGKFEENGVNLLECGLIEHVYTTNSIFTKEHEKITAFNIREVE